MSDETIEFLSAVLLVSSDAERLMRFYRDDIGLPLEREQHGPTHVHWGCELGDLHFAIHPTTNFGDADPGVGAMKLAFTVFDIEAFVARLEARGVALRYPPQDRGFAIMTAVTDPDGNEVEFTQLSEGWFSHLARRRAEGIDIIHRWNEAKGN